MDYDSDLDMNDFDWTPFRLAEIPHLHVYSYHHLDDLSFARNPKDVLTYGSKPENFDKLLNAVKERFRKAGWEGDGELQLIWLPPFVDFGTEDTWGNYLWHVKQENNGTSWIASKDPLAFKRIKDQNESTPENSYLVSVIFHSGKHFLTTINELVDATRRRLSSLSPIGEQLAHEIGNELLISLQGDMISNFQDFLDNCYLEVLLQVVDEGNPRGLKLKKFKAQLSPSSYIPDIDGGSHSEDKVEVGKWFTLKGIVSDLWQSYKFEPFQNKWELLFKTCDFEVDENIAQTIRKHIQLRNCVQHHSRRVTEEALKQVGLSKFTLLSEEDEPITLESGDQITFSYRELFQFAKTFHELTGNFDTHMAKRVNPVRVIDNSKTLKKT